MLVSQQVISSAARRASLEVWGGVIQMQDTMTCISQFYRDPVVGSVLWNRMCCVAPLCAAGSWFLLKSAGFLQGIIASIQLERWVCFPSGSFPPLPAVPSATAFLCRHILWCTKHSFSKLLKYPLCTSEYASIIPKKELGNWFPQTLAESIENWSWYQAGKVWQGVLPDSVVSFPSRVPNASSLLHPTLLLTSLYLYHGMKPSFASFRKECCLLDEEIRNKKKK